MQTYSGRFRISTAGAIAAAALVGASGLAALAIPTLLSVLKVYNQPKPAGPPPWYPARGWPLWFVAFAFRHVRLAGFLLTIGLVLNVLVPVKLPLPWL